ncbi:MAG: RNase adapter RapZ [Coriobacteriia bacterium]|nr:RNase adapter RapZ [Coriobacteriia bacterium]
MAEAVSTGSEPVKSPPELIVITGMSGAGRSDAMHTFEDLGYFCIDNLPPSFISQLVELAELSGSRLKRLAVVSDVRGYEFFSQLAGELSRLKERGIVTHILFLDASDEVLIRRFKETRRRHPMCAEGQPLAQGIRAERDVLAGIKDLTDFVIDTSNLRPQDLRQAIRGRFAESMSGEIAVTVSSFGFKYGVPSDADLVMDVRFLPNPYYDPALRPLTGLDGPVADFVLSHSESVEFLGRWTVLLDSVMPGYVMEGKHHLSITLGCTGGMHRSVTLAEKTADHLRTNGYRVAVLHRDIGRDRTA